MIKRNALRYLVLVTMGALVSIVHAERNDLEEIVVIGSEDEIVKVPGSGALLTEDDLERFDYVDLHQTLSSIPGMYVREEDGFGLRPNIGIRGATPDRSQKITILEDGILITPAPYSAPAAYYVPNISRIENIEVLKGPSAISQGPHTVAGAINFVTKPLEETSNQIDVSFGSDEYYKVQGLLSGVEERTAWQLDLNSFGSAGFKDLDSGGDTGFVRSEANLKIQHDFDSKREQRIVFKLGWADEDADETYLGLTDADFALEPTRRYRASQLANFETDHLTFHLNYGVRFSEELSLNTKVYWHEFNRAWKKLDGFIDGPPLQRVLTSPSLFTNEYLLLKGDRDSDRSDKDTLDVTTNDRSFNSMGIQVTAKYELSTGSIDHQIAAGFRYHYDEVDRDHRQEGYFMVSGLMVSDEQNRGSKVQNHAETDAYSLFLSDQISFGQFTMTLGVRHEEIEGEKINLQTNLETENDQSKTTGGLGFSWQVSNDFNVIAGVYDGFSPAAPGSNAEPEETTNFEYGIRYRGEYGNLDLIGFFSDYENLLGRCRVSDPPPCVPGAEYNGGAVEVAGAELSYDKEIEISADLLLTLSFNYTYTESAFQETFLSGFSQWGLVRKGDSLPYLPEHMGRIELGVIGSNWSVVAAYRSQSEMREEPGRGDIEDGLHADQYGIVDLTGTWRINQQWEAQLLLLNAFDEDAIVSHRPYGARPSKPLTAVGRVKYNF